MDSIIQAYSLIEKERYSYQSLVPILLPTLYYIHWRHSNLGQRAMGQVVFLPRPEIIYINTPFSLPRPEVIYIWAWLISAPNGVSEYN